MLSQAIYQLTDQLKEKHINCARLFQQRFPRLRADDAVHIQPFGTLEVFHFFVGVRAEDAVLGKLCAGQIQEPLRVFDVLPAAASADRRQMGADLRFALVLPKNSLVRLSTWTNKSS